MSLSFRISGERKGKKIAVAVCYGPAMASEVANIFCHLGIKTIIVTGTFGGLKKGVEVGDIFVIEEALRYEGSSDWYLSIDKKVYASKNLTKDFIEALNKEGIKYHLGNIVTVSSILGTQKTPLDFSGKAIGVDLETAAVFAVAETFRIPAASILVASDNLAEGIMAYVPKDSPTKKAKTQGIKKTIKTVFEVIDKL